MVKTKITNLIRVVVYFLYIVIKLYFSFTRKSVKGFSTKMIPFNFFVFFYNLKHLKYFVHRTKFETIVFYYIKITTKKRSVILATLSITIQLIHSPFQSKWKTLPNANGNKLPIKLNMFCKCQKTSKREAIRSPWRSQRKLRTSLSRIFKAINNQSLIVRIETRLISAKLV